MKQLKLTKTKVDSLPFVASDMLNGRGKPLRQVDYFDRDLPCFGVRVSSRTKTYFVLSRVNGKKSRVVIGKHGTITADDARRKAKGKLQELSEGVDLNRQKARDRAEKISLVAVLDQYIKDRAGTDKKLSSNTVLDYRKVLRLYVSDWLNKPMIDITSVMIEIRHKKIKHKIGPIPANKLARYLRLLFNYAIKTPSINLDLATHPVVVQWGEEKRRKTRLSTAQIAVWVQAVKGLPSPMMQDYFMLLFYTGLRKNEALSLKWSDVNTDDGYFVIPGDVTKNREDHYLPITNQLKIIFNRRATVRENDFVFPGRGKTKHLAEPRKQIVRIEHETQKILNKVVTDTDWKEFFAKNPSDKIKPGIKFCNHDLRRTFSTIAESLVSYSQLKQLLNHSTKDDVTAGYVVLEVEQLRKPAQRIADEIDTLSTKRNGEIIPFRRSAL